MKKELLQVFKNLKSLEMISSGKFHATFRVMGTDLFISYYSYNSTFIGFRMAPEFDKIGYLLPKDMIKPEEFLNLIQDKEIKKILLFNLDLYL